MKTLIVVRHGEDGSNGKLTNGGRNKMGRLADKIALLTKGMTVAILSAVAPRATESADILGHVLNEGVHVHRKLSTDNIRPNDLWWAMGLVEAYSEIADVIIIVSHLEYSERLTEYFMEEQLGVNASSRGIEKGEAWVIDCERRTLTKLTAGS